MRRLGGLLCALALPAVVAHSQSAPSSPATPSAPHERLAPLVGNWTIEELPKEQQFVDACDWMAGGRRHIVCRGRSRTAAGEPQQWLSMFSYRASDDTYLFNILQANGDVEMAIGRAIKDGFEFDAISPPAGERRRWMMAMLTKERFRYTAMASKGSEPFRVVETMHYVAIKPK